MVHDADAVARDEQDVYQLRAVISGVSPLIWRRLLVTAQTTIAQLHAILQTVFDWGGEHLHRFCIHGTEYGIDQVGGSWFRDDARTVRLGELGLRLGEKFRYEYNFFAGWQVDLRVEQIQPCEPNRSYPYCCGGRRAGPPEGWGGPWEFLERTQPHLVLQALLHAAEIVGQFLARTYLIFMGVCDAELRVRCRSGGLWWLRVGEGQGDGNADQFEDAPLGGDGVGDLFDALAGEVDCFSVEFAEVFE